MILCLPSQLSRIISDREITCSGSRAMPANSAQKFRHPLRRIILVLVVDCRSCTSRVVVNQSVARSARSAGKSYQSRCSTKPLFPSFAAVFLHIRFRPFCLRWLAPRYQIVRTARFLLLRSGKPVRVRGRRARVSCVRRSRHGPLAPGCPAYACRRP